MTDSTDSNNPDNSQPQPTDRAGSRSLLWLPLALVIIGVDQYTKIIIVDRLIEYERISVLPIFDIVRFHNTGAAFSLLADAGGWQNWLFTAIALIVSAGILWYQWVLPHKGARILGLGLALVLAGAIGNLIDRLNYGYVVDFLFFHYQQWSWPAFNVADSAITIGVVLVIFDSLFLERKRIAEAANSRQDLPGD
jgi:signal peptidase II